MAKTSQRWDRHCHTSVTWFEWNKSSLFISLLVCRFARQPVGVSEFSLPSSVERWLGQEQGTDFSDGPIERIADRARYWTLPVHGRCFPSIFSHIPNVRSLPCCGQRVWKRRRRCRILTWPLPRLQVAERPSDCWSSHLHRYEKSLPLLHPERGR